MYLQIKEDKFQCLDFLNNSGNLTFLGIENVTLPVQGELKLCSEDGFILMSCKSTDYARIVYQDTVLLLTNEPESVPTIPQLDPITQVQLAVAELAEVSAQRDIENKLAIVELAEAMTGGK